MHTPRGVFNNSGASKEQLDSDGEVKMLSPVGKDQPTTSATHAGSEQSEPAGSQKAQHRRPRKTRRPQSIAHAHEELPNAAAVAIPKLSPASENGVVDRAMKNTDTNLGSRSITIAVGDVDKVEASVSHIDLSPSEDVAVLLKSCATTCSSSTPVDGESSNSLGAETVTTNLGVSSSGPIATSSAPDAEASVTSQHNAVVDQPLDNLYTMIRQRREQLFQGPTITIHIGKYSVTSIYQRVAMATSPLLNKHFTANPESLDFTVQGYIAPEAVEYMLNTWMNDIRHDFEVIAMPLQPSFSNNVAILRAARYFGMETYAKWILTKHVEYLREYIPSYEEIALVERNRSSNHDRKYCATSSTIYANKFEAIWTFMVNHLSHARYQGQIPDPGDFEAFLAEHLALSMAMDEADAFFAGRVEKARRERWEQNEAERLERVAREQEVAASLSRKLEDKSGSGLMLVSEAEAALLRGR